MENKPTISNEEAAEDSKLTHRGASDTCSGKGKGKTDEAVPDDDKKTKKEEEADMVRAFLFIRCSIKSVLISYYYYLPSFVYHLP